MFFEEEENKYRHISSPEMIHLWQDTHLLCILKRLQCDSKQVASL